jgi:hypothetical protein
MSRNAKRTACSPLAAMTKVGTEAARCCYHAPASASASRQCCVIALGPAPRRGAQRECRRPAEIPLRRSGTLLSSRYGSHRQPELTTKRLFTGPWAHFVIGGEAVVLGPDGVSDFAALHSGKHTKRAAWLHSSRATVWFKNPRTASSCASLATIPINEKALEIGVSEHRKNTGGHQCDPRSPHGRQHLPEMQDVVGN